MMSLKSKTSHSVLAVVPARGGSKGVPLKNIRPLNGRPLIAHVGDCLKDVPIISRAVVSTDHEDIAREAERAGIAAPFRRPEALSGDRIGDLDVLVHALTAMEKIDACIYDIVVMLQPTSPLRQPDHVSAAISKLITDELDSVWTVTSSDLKYHPLKQLALSNGGLRYFDDRGATIIARQQLEPVYHRNGICYAFTRECLLQQRTIMGRRSGAVVIPGPSVSIDTLEDFAEVERILRSRPTPSNKEPS